MRVQKEKIKLLKEGGASEDVIKEAQARYRKQMSEYEKFSDTMNMKPQRKRNTIGDGKTMKGVKVLDNSVKNDRMGTTRKADVIEQDDLINAMPHEQFERIKRRFERQGGLFVMDEYAQEILNARGVEAITYCADTILLRPHPSRAAVFEELIHVTQYRLGENDGAKYSKLICEIKAQQKLLRNKEAYQLTQQDIDLTIHNLNEYIEDLKRFCEVNGYEMPNFRAI